MSDDLRAALPLTTEEEAAFRSRLGRLRDAGMPFDTGDLIDARFLATLDRERAAALAASDGLDVALRAEVKRALDNHLGRVASSEPFSAADYRRHGIAARDILRAALRSTPEAE